MHVTTGVLEHGFVSEELQLAGAHRDRPRRPDAPRPRTCAGCRRGAAATVDPLQLQPGDFVVHEQHGVGRYVEMVQRDGAGRDPRVPRARVRARASAASPADRLYVPTDQLDQVTRYVGGEAPTLHRLGGADWAKTKGRARKAVKQIAAELDPALLRAAWPRTGHAFGPDTPWQRELEDAFPYVETPDQLAAHRRGQGRHGAAGPDGPARSAATSATARPRSRCARRSRPCRTASRSRCWCRRRCWSQQHLHDVRRALCAASR